MPDKLRITTIQNPFRPQERDIHAIEFVAGKPLEEYLTKTRLPVKHGIDYAVSVNGAVVPESEQKSLVLRPGDWVAVCPVVHGGGDGGKNPLVAILGIVLSVVTMGVGNLASGLTWAGANSAGQIVGIMGWKALGFIAALAVMTVGGLLLSAMAGSLPDTTIDNRESTQTYSWSTMQSLTGQGGSVQILYGTVRTAGQILAEHVTTDGDKQYYNVLLCGGEGPAAAITAVEINSNPIENYDGVVVDVRYGTNDQSVIQNFNDTFDDLVVGSVLNVGESTTRTTVGNAGSGLEITIEFPSGLYFLNNAGDTETTSVTITASYKLHGDSSYTAWGTWVISEKNTSAFRRVYRLDNLLKGQYDVQVSCTAKAGTTTRYANTVYWQTLSHILYDDFIRPNKVLVGVKALATDQLSGSRPTVTWLQTRAVVWVWDPELGAYESKDATNPAWAAYDMIHGARKLVNVNTLSEEYVVKGAPVSLISYSDFEGWAAFCVSRGLAINILVEKAQGLWDALSPFESVGRGKVIMRGTKFGAIYDAPGSAVQLFTVGNIKPDSFIEEFLDLKSRANAVEVTFTNSNKNYQRDTLTVYGEDYDTEDIIKNPTQITLDGIVTAEAAYREAKYRLRLNKYLTRTCTFDVSIDAIACQVGDIINVQHDVPLWGEGGRLVGINGTTVALDKQVLLQPAKTYTLMVRSADDVIQNRTVAAVTEDTTTDLLTVTAPFSSAAAQYDVYAFGESGVAAKPFRIMNIMRTQDAERKIVALEYNAAVYTEQEDIPIINYVSASGAISNLLVSERSDVAGIVWLDVSWQAARNLYAGARILLDNRLVGKVGSTQTSFSVSGIEQRTYAVKVQGIDMFGNPLSSIETTHLVQAVAPPDAFSYGVVQNQRQLEHSWAAPGSIAGVEIRRLDPTTPTWENGQKIVSNAAGSRFIDLNIKLGSWAYGIKTIGKNGLYSANMVTGNIVIDTIPSSNIVVTADLLAAPSGTFVGCSFSGGNIVMDSNLTWAQFAAKYPTWNNAIGVVWGDNSVPSASYTSQSYDVGKVVQALVAIDLQRSAGSGTDVEIQWSYSEDNVAWSVFAEFLPGSYKFRYHKWKIILASQNGKANAVTVADVIIDVPDVLQKYKDVEITNASSGVTITFDEAFVETPTVTANLVGATAGYCLVVSKTTTQAVIKAFNSSGTAVTGFIDTQVLGY